MSVILKSAVADEGSAVVLFFLRERTITEEQTQSGDGANAPLNSMKMGTGVPTGLRVFLLFTPGFRFAPPWAILGGSLREQKAWPLALHRSTRTFRADPSLLTAFVAQDDGR